MLLNSVNNSSDAPRNRNSVWRYLILLIVLGLGLIYSAPNLFGEHAAIQISSQRENGLSAGKVDDIVKQFEAQGIGVQKASLEGKNAIFILKDPEQQRSAQTLAKEALGRGYVVALNLAAATPDWLAALNANPMYLGLDLRGGVYFLMEVDVDAMVESTIERRKDEIRRILREEKIRYTRIVRKGNAVEVSILKPTDQAQAENVLQDEFVDNEVKALDAQSIRLTFTENSIRDLQRFAVRQNMTTLRNRVNELGVAEPVIQQQGANRIVVQLPGVQDTARAKDILGATATLEYRLVSGNSSRAAQSGIAPPGTELFYDRSGRPVLLKREIIVTGDSVINAQSGLDTDSGSPMVSVTLDSVGGKRMLATTKQNVGQPMAVVFIETRSELREEKGETVRKRIKTETVINVATIRGQFANRFQTTGLDSSAEARDLALLLRAGALAAPVDIVEERTIGPSLGADNINQGFLSVVIGLLLVLGFMIVRYKAFGIIADCALVLNIVLVIAALSVLQATLTLPGIAGIVLTVGMAVDANVLIFERIREEIKQGSSIQMAISAGYNRAFVTIADANITTLIAALVLFGFGTGPIKGFAVTLSLGIITSMFTAIVLTRAVVNRIYGDKTNVKKLWI